MLLVAVIAVATWLAGLGDRAQHVALPGLARVAHPAVLPGGAPGRAQVVRGPVRAQVRGGRSAARHSRRSGCARHSPHPRAGRSARCCRHRRAALCARLPLPRERALRQAERGRGPACHRLPDVGHLVHRVAAQRHDLGDARRLPGHELPGAAQLPLPRAHRHGGAGEALSPVPADELAGRNHRVGLCLRHRDLHLVCGRVARRLYWAGRDRLAAGCGVRAVVAAAQRQGQAHRARRDRSAAPRRLRARGCEHACGRGRRRGSCGPTAAQRRRAARRGVGADARLAPGTPADRSRQDRGAGPGGAARRAGRHRRLAVLQQPAEHPGHRGRALGSIFRRSAACSCEPRTPGKPAGHVCIARALGRAPILYS